MNYRIKHIHLYGSQGSIILRIANIDPEKYVKTYIELLPGVGSEIVWIIHYEHENAFLRFLHKFDTVVSHHSITILKADDQRAFYLIYSPKENEIMLKDFDNNIVYQEKIKGFISATRVKGNQYMIKRGL